MKTNTLTKSFDSVPETIQYTDSCEEEVTDAALLSRIIFAFHCLPRRPFWTLEEVYEGAVTLQKKGTASIERIESMLRTMQRECLISESIESHRGFPDTTSKWCWSIRMGGADRNWSVYHLIGEQFE